MGFTESQMHFTDLRLFDNLRLCVKKYLGKSNICVK
jgi:hypothetical protein